MYVLFVGKKSSTFAPLLRRLEKEDDIHPIYVSSGAAGLQCMEGNAGKITDLVIIDEQLSDMSGIQFVRQLVAINPLVSTALLGSMTEADFHEATEGLGILLQLPPVPRAYDAAELLARYTKIAGLISAR